MSPCGRLGPVFQAPLLRLDGILGRALAQILRTRLFEAGLLLKRQSGKDRIVIDGMLGIDVSKNTLDASMSSCNRGGSGILNRALSGISA